MCLICIEYHKKRMTREELKRALPEMITFAKKDSNEKKHYEKLSELSDDEAELELEVASYIKSNT
jgi:arsenate reductase-like glutaredoxin family protein